MKSLILLLTAAAFLLGQEGKTTELPQTYDEEVLKKFIFEEKERVKPDIYLTLATEFGIRLTLFPEVDPTDLSPEKKLHNILQARQAVTELQYHCFDISNPRFIYTRKPIPHHKDPTEEQKKVNSYVAKNWPNPWNIYKSTCQSYLHTFFKYDREYFLALSPLPNPFPTHLDKESALKRAQETLDYYKENPNKLEATPSPQQLLSYQSTNLSIALARFYRDMLTLEN